ncbi:MAG: hypothetical protein RLZZ501_2415 [Pseudomonadota bacterium]|jgi:hypothetical protein
MKSYPHIIPAAVLAVTLAAAIGAAHADSVPRPGPAAFCADQDARLAAHLAYAESKLALSPAQTEEFRRLSDTLKAAQAPLKALCPTEGQPPAAALPARLDRQQKMIEAEGEVVRRSAPALVKFYQTLTPAQQALADDLLVVPGGHPGPHFGGHRFGPDGQPGPGPDRRGEAPQSPNCAGR